MAEILTVAWMLTLLCTFGAEVLCLAILAIARPLPPRASSPLAGALTGGLLLASLVSGLACLLLTPVVWRLRAVKPPPAVTIGVVLVGLMPMVTLVVLYWLNS